MMDILKLQARRARPLDLEAINFPADGQVPSYHASTGKFNWVTISGISGGTRYWSETATEDWPKPISAMLAGFFRHLVLRANPGDMFPTSGIAFTDLDLNVKGAINWIQPGNTVNLYHYANGSLQLGVQTEVGGTTKASVVLYPVGRVAIAGSGTGAIWVGDPDPSTVRIIGNELRAEVSLLRPLADNSGEIGNDWYRWARVRAVEVITGDLKLKGEKAEWIITEGKDGLYAINNNTGKKYRLKMEEVEE